MWCLGSLLDQAGSLFSAWGILACELLVAACGILVPWPGIRPWPPALGLQSLSHSSVQSLSHVQLFVTPWTVALQASLSITNSQSLLTFMCESVMPSNHLILCYPLLLLPSIFPSIQIFSSESVLLIRWPKYWSFSFSVSPSNEYSGLISFRVYWFDLLALHCLYCLFSHWSSSCYSLASASVLLLEVFKGQRW